MLSERLESVLALILRRLLGNTLCTVEILDKTRGDSHSLMQVNAPAVDMVMLYIRQAVNHYGPVTLTVLVPPAYESWLVGMGFPTGGL